MYFSACSNNEQMGKTCRFSSLFNYRNIMPSCLWPLPHTPVVSRRLLHACTHTHTHHDVGHEV